MIVLLLAVGALLLTLPALPRAVPRRLPVNEYVPVAMAALVAGWLAVESALVLMALPTVTHTLGVAGVADACHHVLAPLSSSPSAVGWFAAVSASMVAVRLLLSATRAWAQA